VAAGYGAVHRAIEEAQALAPTSIEAADKILREMRKQMDDLPKQAPSIPDHVWKRVSLQLTPTLGHLPMAAQTGTAGAQPPARNEEVNRERKAIV
jgi:hypothetical protein